MATEELPEVLRVAREHRKAGTTPWPSELWAQAGGDKELYVHAMHEAGCIVQKATGQPLIICPVCGFDHGAAT